MAQNQIISIRCNIGIHGVLRQPDKWCVMTSLPYHCHFHHSSSQVSVPEPQKELSGSSKGRQLS